MKSAVGKKAEPRGLVIVNTGDGKGKTTAAMGVILRAWGRGLRICVIQFIKPPSVATGEYKAARKLGIEWHHCGDGFVWESKDPRETVDVARAGWQLAQAKIVSGDYDLVVLDEFTYPLTYGWLDAGEVMAWLSAHKPPQMHLIITGRDAPQSVIDCADLVTEMKLVKHPYEQGVKAQLGIEF